MFEKKVIETLKYTTNELYDFLISCNVSPKSKKLKDLLNGLNEIIAIKKDKKYLGVHLKKGYVDSIIPIDGIIEEQELPNDIKRPYYRYEKGRILLDEKKRRRLWED